MRKRGERVQGRRVHGGVLLVPCLLNHVYRYWFLADTGAARTMLSLRAAEEIGVDLSHPLRQEHIASIHRLALAPVIRLDSLQVGSQSASPIDVLVLAFPTDLRIDGLLGVNFLGQFRATFEFDRSILVLRYWSFAPLGRPRKGRCGRWACSRRALPAQSASLCPGCQLRKQSSMSTRKSYAALKSVEQSTKRCSVSDHLSPPTCR